jgi:hypothetical protein
MWIANTKMHEIIKHQNQSLSLAHQKAIHKHEKQSIKYQSIRNLRQRFSMEPNWLHIANRLQRFKGCHKGEQMVLICNGPSLNRTDFSRIRKQLTMGMNKIFLGLNRYKLYPRYYAAINNKVIEQSESQIKKLNCIQFIPPQASTSLLQESAFTYWIKCDLASKGFSTDITTGIHQGWTVTHAALQIAYFMGFQRVIIVGMDHRYTYEGNPNELKSMDGPDPNHFIDSYFQGCEWNNPDLNRSEESYSIARHTYELDGRCIIDCTVDGACQVFEKRSLTEILP